MIENMHVLANAVEFNSDSIVITDNTGVILYVNQAMSIWSGIDKTDILNKKPSIFKSGIHNEVFYKELWGKISKGESWQGRVFNKTKDNKIIPFSLTITPIKNEKGEITHFIGIHRNISQDLKTEEALLKSQNEAIEDSKSKTQFLSIMSHEIRNPLNAIIGASEIITDSIKNSEVQSWGTLLKSTTESLLHIVDDILDYSKIKSEKLEIVNSEFKIWDLLKDIKVIYDFFSQKKGIDFEIINEVDSQEILYGDLIRIRQVLHNLVSNAFKFTEKGNVKIIIKKNNLTGKKGNLLFEVKDTGIGIHKDNIKNLFTPFSQADSSIQGKFGGTGLGLAICKQLSEKMGGEVWVESELNKGSSFYFSVNVDSKNKIQTLKEEKKKPEILDFQNLVSPILVVDDLNETLLIIEYFFKSLNLSYEIVDSGQAAIALIKKKFFPIIFLDLEMPLMNGFECINKIKKIQEKEEHKSFIIALSGYVGHDIVEKAIGFGFDFYIQKPISKEILLNKIKEISYLIKNKKNNFKHNELN